jgi:hypothetical protein
MPAGVGVSNRVVEGVRVAIQELRDGKVLHNRVGTEEPSQPGGVETSLVVVDAQSRPFDKLRAVHLSLAGE